MLHPNNHRTAPGWNPYRFLGQPDKGLYTTRAGKNRGMFFASDMVLTASRPEGGAPISAWVHPYTTGGMSGVSFIDFAGEGDIIKGSTINGDGTITFGQEAFLSLITSLLGDGAWLFSDNGALLKLSVSFQGDGSWSLIGTNPLSMTVSLIGDGAWNFIGDSDLREKLSLSGGWTPYTELSPENLANAVWETELPGSYTEGMTGYILLELLKLTGHKVARAGDVITIYESDGITIWKQYDLSDGGRVEV